MIIYRQWTRRRHGEATQQGRFFDYDGWFLFGILPLYVRHLRVRW